MKSFYFIMIILIGTLYQSDIIAQDYQYQYFQHKDKGKYVPFSDYIPRVRLHNKTVPHFLEDYYELYGMKLYYNENSLRKNIARLKTALLCKFRHPSNSIVKVESEQEYLKYRHLFFMHINLLIMRNYMKVASRYDMKKIYFYHRDFSKEIKDSLNIAEEFYKEAIPYWEKAKEYALSASKIKISTDLGKFESERYSIKTGSLNFKKIISNHLNKIITKKMELDRFSKR